MPVAWTVETAKDAEQAFALGLIDANRAHGFAVKTAIMDKGYDTGPIHDGCMDRGICPVTPLRETPAVKRGDHHTREISGWRRSALIHVDAGLHSPVGQRHLVARRL